MSNRRVLELPFELVLRVVECLAPSTTVAFPTRSPTARTIRSFLLVSRLTYPVALRLLYTHCLYIDNSERLRLLLISLNRYHPFDFIPSSASRNETDDESTLPVVNILPCLQNLYLAPFPRNSIDDLPTAYWIFELFSITRNTLRRLVTRIPLRSVPTEQDHLNVRPRLRAAFNELTALEEFVAVEDDLFLTVHEPWMIEAHDEVPVWSKWTKLRRLGLYGCDLMHQHYAYLFKLPALESILIHETTADGKDCWNAFFGRLAMQESTLASTSVSTSTSTSTPAVRPIAAANAAAINASPSGTTANLQPRQHDIQIIYLNIDFDYGQDAEYSIAELLQPVFWARKWNNEHHLPHTNDNEESNNSNRSRITVSAVAAREAWRDVTEWHDVRRDWAKAATVEGGLWDLSRNPRFRRSHLDSDLWLHRSLFGDEHEHSEAYDVSKHYLWSPSVF